MEGRAKNKRVAPPAWRWQGPAAQKATPGKPTAMHENVWSPASQVVGTKKTQRGQLPEGAQQLPHLPQGTYSLIAKSCDWLLFLVVLWAHRLKTVIQLGRPISQEKTGRKKWVQRSQSLPLEKWPSWKRQGPREEGENLGTKAQAFIPSQIV
jgi:hypothetical protein